MKTYKTLLAATASLLSLNAVAASTPSWMIDRFYMAVFGGGGTFTSSSITQSGTALYDDPLSVNAKGDASSTGVWAIGATLGYKWSELFPQNKNADWHVMPSTELEGYYFHGTLDGTDLNNPTTRLESHDFSVSYPMNNGVFLVNGVLNFSYKDSKLHPYIGGGVGTAIVSISGATSTQTAPAEPDINHYNSNPDASDWTFATQAKAGLRYAIDDKTSVFVEYRFLYLSPTDFTFGSTQYPGVHIATTPWDVDIGGMYYNMGTAGIQFDA